MSQAPHLLLSGCGPGEIVGWVQPLLDALALRDKDWRVSLVLWPRFFPSGSEAEVAAKTGRIHRVIEPRQALRLLLDPGSSAGREPSLVLHLGGSSLLSWALSRRLGCPLAGYAEKPLPFADRFQRIYCADANTRDSMAAGPGDPGRLRLVGNLFVDSMAELRRRRLALGGAAEDHLVTVGLFPGSRALQLRHGLPLLTPLVRLIAGQIPGCRFLLARSPFTAEEALIGIVEEARATGRCEPGTRIARSGDDLLLTAPGSPAIPIVERTETFLYSDVIVSSPGTNTAEAAALGIPAVTVVPYFAEQLQGRGWVRHLERLPLIGVAGKRLLVRLLGMDMRYYSHANVRAGREIVPEVHGRLDARRIAEAAVALLRDPTRLARTSTELARLMGPGGAAECMIDEIEAILQHR